MKISTRTIYNDLLKIREMFGDDFILVFCAKIIFEHNWWNWNNLKTGITKDPDSKKLIIETGILGETQDLSHN